MSEPAEREIVVDLSKMTFGDLKRVLAGGAADAQSLIPLLDRVVVGGIDDIPISDMSKIMDAIQKAIEQASNPKN